MYTKVVEAEGESRLVFFARTDIKPGQELTYDYRSVHMKGTSSTRICLLHKVCSTRTITRSILPMCMSGNPFVQLLLSSSLQG